MKQSHVKTTIKVDPGGVPNCCVSVRAVMEMGEHCNRKRQSRAPRLQEDHKVRKGTAQAEGLRCGQRGFPTAAKQILDEFGIRHQLI